MRHGLSGLRKSVAFVPFEKFFFAALCCLILPALVSPGQAVAQSVTVGSASGGPGTAVDVPVSFTPGATGIATLQFDLSFPASLTAGTVSTGAAATAAGKSASSSAITGGIRVLIFGLNQNVLEAGIIASVRFNIAAGSAPATLPVTISNLVASDALGGNVSAGGTSGSVAVTTGSTDITPPLISAVASSGITNSAVTISWTTDESSDSQVDYGTTAVYGATTSSSTMVIAHVLPLSGLAPNMLYHYRVRSRDAAGNLAFSGDFTFMTTSDTTAPQISNVLAASVHSNNAVITWTTDEASDSQAEYGTTASYGSLTEINSAGVTAHMLTLSGLSPDTTYHFRVKSKDAAGNLATSGDFTFTTTTSDTDTPVFSNVRSSNVTNTSATITWTTNEAADSQVEFGTTPSYGRSTVLNPQMTTDHSQSLSGLIPGTVYHFRVKSRDAAGNLGTSTDFTFMTQGDGITLFYPRPLTTPGAAPGSPAQEFVGFGIANLDSQTATLRFTAYNTSGAAISGQGITNPVTRELASNRQLPFNDHELFGGTLSGPEAVGWVKIESTSRKVTGFFMMFNAGLTELDGADFSSTPVTSFLFPEIKNQGFTKINIFNPNSDPATLQFTLIGADGRSLAAASRQIPGNGALAADLFADVFPGGTPSSDSYVKVTASQSVLPFELLGSPSKDFSSLYGQDASSGASTLYSPQYAIGGAWTSSVSIVNLDATPGFVTARLFGEDGAQIGMTRILPVEASGKMLIDGQNFFEPFRLDPSLLSEGYLVITTSGIRISGSVVFGDREHGILSSALPLSTGTEQSFVFGHVSSDDLFYTGLAVVNPNMTDVHMTLDLYNDDGTLASSVPRTIAAGHRFSQLLTEIFPELVGQQRLSGYFRVTSDAGVATFAVFGTKTLSLLSAIPPQIVR